MLDNRLTLPTSPIHKTAIHFSNNHYYIISHKIHKCKWSKRKSVFSRMIICQSITFVSFVVPCVCLQKQPKSGSKPVQSARQLQPVKPSGRRTTRHRQGKPGGFGARRAAAGPIKSAKTRLKGGYRPQKKIRQIALSSSLFFFSFAILESFPRQFYKRRRMAQFRFSRRTPLIVPLICLCRFWRVLRLFRGILCGSMGVCYLVWFEIF